jgi:hypothetical protein
MIDNELVQTRLLSAIHRLSAAGPHRHAYERLRPQDVQADYQLKDISAGPSFKIQGLTDEQRQRIGDFCVWDSDAGSSRLRLSRDDVGEHHEDQRRAGRRFPVQLADGASKSR